ncbi:glucose 1-dehydrogenase [Azospirillum brasilense]|uniref:Glucose 1-dehydrogenase n=1 Tax=Azospirillum brasilense TaxID=192 RepID=A0A0P0ELR5_AZOBR|nr:MULTISPECIES: glucose 1-dehydrogenase [Azospirillum]ALJ36951.1 shikimate dehydrogenase [Azospirillum brasilense]MDW7551633.1 glucose 1-dehydrogenase [Azospirillum brasilense]MDW7591068.1 glucose 1-dehydrogenase [Azospirillum brasilense]MDW7626238.1 glucose 1-dehydrogenase [Azospirillum brasilense]MDX5951414.1 glucose 1-dehydrogenase [Azospirillum brasilense]
MPTLKDKSIIVTGAGRGIGATMARALAADGARLVIADRTEEDASAVAESIRATGGDAVAVTVDVRDRAAVRRMIDTAVASFGRLDVLFNNAGVAQTKPFLDITEEDWRFVTDVNALGVLIGMQEAIKTFRAQGGGGKIINTASIAGKQGYEPLAHYSASKFAVVALTQAAARAFGKEKITANAICPGVVATEMWKIIDKGFRDTGLTTAEDEAFNQFAAGAVLGRPSTAEDLVGVARFLASSDSDFMTGQSLLVDGGMVFA